MTIKTLLLKIVGQLCYFILFFGLFLGSLFVTFGYRYDFNDRAVIQTSVIDICSTPSEADLYLDNALYDKKACQKIYGLPVGSHTLKIVKDGYLSWQKNLYLNEETASLFPGIFLVPNPEHLVPKLLEPHTEKVWNSPNSWNIGIYDSKLKTLKVISMADSDPILLEAPNTIKDLTWIDNDQVVIDTPKGRYKAQIRSGEWTYVDESVFHPLMEIPKLEVQNGELWLQKGRDLQFITRYSEPIESAQMFYNDSNYLIATRNAIRLCDRDGENCHMLAEKDEKTPVIHPQHSKKILYLHNGNLMVLDVQLSEKPINQVL